MRSSLIAATLMVLVLATVPHAQRVAARCGDLTTLQLQGAAVKRAEIVSAGGFVPATLRGRAGGPPPTDLFAAMPSFCRVAVTATPSSDSDIKIEVWLPVSGWNGKLQAVGEGGLAGFVPYALMAPVLAQGYVAAGTDTGHTGATTGFMPAHPEKLVDFAHRATHELAVAAKAVVAAFYGRGPAWSYYEGCSGAGRHALASAQQYPEDFNGIVAGAASWDQARFDAARIGINLSVNQSAESRIPPAKYPTVHRAVLDACDAADGVTDGVLEDPRACAFDYSALTCAGADGPMCLTPAEVRSAKILTSPFADPASGRTLFDSHLWPGSELGWATLAGAAPLTNSLDRVRNFHLKDPAWEFRLENIGADVERAVRQDNGLLASVNFDLRPFFKRGGRLLMWHGWSDPQVVAQHSVAFFENVRRTVGAADADRSLALFMLPGVGHCRGGEGPDTFDKMAAISEWVEHGRKPARIVASRFRDGRVDRTRPLCPFPQVARYRGTGSTDDAANFSCFAPPPAAAKQ
jgi:feruloyl esterase